MSNFQRDLREKKEPNEHGGVKMNPTYEMLQESMGTQIKQVRKVMHISFSILTLFILGMMTFLYSYTMEAFALSFGLGMVLINVTVMFVNISSEKTMTKEFKVKADIYEHFTRMHIAIESLHRDGNGYLATDENGEMYMVRMNQGRVTVFEEK